jgi:hypothetical protein
MSRTGTDRQCYAGPNEPGDEIAVIGEPGTLKIGALPNRLGN